METKVKHTAFLLAALLACSGSTSAPEPVLQTGAYSYSAAVPFVRSDGSIGTSNYAGTLTVMYAAADSIAGTFAVPGYRPETKLGFRNGDAYVLYAYTTGGVTLAHRIAPSLACTVKYIGPDPSGTCRISR
jgi:hypothetical protein